ncbi:MAG: MG2 domain-containing protein [Candidatus Baldrarchaeota archaeon]
MRKAVYCILFLLIVVALVQIPINPQITAEASPGNEITTEPSNTSITLKKGEYYILKVNITNSGTEALKLKKIDVQRSDITQIINTTHPLKWLMPSNKSWALILFNTTALKPATYNGWVNFTFESSVGITYNTVSYSITVQPSDPIIQVDPPYLYYESLSYEESVVKIIVKNLIDVNLTVALEMPSELSEICIPLKDLDTIPPRGHAEYSLLIRSWKIPDIIIDELNFTVISPTSQTWRVPIVLVSHNALNVQNYTLLEKHTVLENNSIIVANGSTTTVNFSVPVGVHQLIINGQSNPTELQWKLYNSTNKMVAYAENVDVAEFSIVDPVPGTWSLLLNNTGLDYANITLKVLVSTPDMIGGTDLLKEKLVVQGKLLGNEEKIFWFYVPPSVSSLNIFTKETTDFLIELYNPFGQPITTLPLVKPLHGTYKIKVISSNPDITNKLPFFMEIETSPIEEISEIPVVITDFIRSEETKIFRFYVPPGIEAFSLDLTVNGSLDCIVESPSGERNPLLDLNLVEAPEHGVWSLYVQASENVTFSISVDEVITTLLGTPPFHVTGRIEGKSIRVFKFYIPPDVENLALNGSSTSQVEWTLRDPTGEIQYSASDITLQVDTIENPVAGVWKLEIDSLETATYSFEVITGNYSFSQVKVLLEDSFLINAGNSESGNLVIQNFGNETLEMVKTEALDPWINILGYNPSEIASSSAGSLNFEVDAENCTYGIYHSFIVIESSWGKHFAEVTMRVLLDLVKIKGSSEILLSNDIPSVSFDILVQNIGNSSASISNVTPQYHISKSVIETRNVSVIKVEKSGLTEGLHYLLPNITISFGASNAIMSFFAPFVIVSGRPYVPNFTIIESVHANILQNNINGHIDEPLSLSIEIMNEANYSTGKVILWSYVTNDFYSLPVSVPSVENCSSVTLDTTVRFARWTKEVVRPLIIIENSSGEFVCITPQNTLSADIEPGIEIVKVWYLPEEPLAHDYIAIKAKLGGTGTSIFTVSTLYMYDNQRKTLYMATSEGGNVYSGVLKPFMQPANVSFITSTVANGRLGFFISDNNGNYYNMKVRTSPPAEEFNITVFTDRPAYRSGSKVLIVGNVTREGSLLINIFVNIKVLDPNGAVIAEDQKITNETGYFAMEMQLTENAIEGIYQVNVTYGEAYEIYEFWVDNTPPLISSIKVTPENPRVGQEIIFEVQVHDNESGIQKVILSYNDGSGWTNITMNSAEENYYTTTLPPMENKTIIRYKVYAWDLAGNVICSEEREVEVIGAAKAWIGTSTIIIISAVAIAAVAVFLVLKKKK